MCLMTCFLCLHFSYCFSFFFLFLIHPHIPFRIAHSEEPNTTNIQHILRAMRIAQPTWNNFYVIIIMFTEGETVLIYSMLSYWLNAIDDHYANTAKRWWNNLGEKLAGQWIKMTMVAMRNEERKRKEEGEADLNSLNLRKNGSQIVRQIIENWVWLIDSDFWERVNDEWVSWLQELRKWCVNGMNVLKEYVRVLCMYEKWNNVIYWT